MKIGLVSLLGIVFVILKLVDTIDWSWVWVTAPFWGEILIAIIVGLFIVLKKS